MTRKREKESKTRLIKKEVRSLEKLPESRREPFFSFDYQNEWRQFNTLAKQEMQRRNAHSVKCLTKPTETPSCFASAWTSYWWLLLLAEGTNFTSEKVWNYGTLFLGWCMLMGIQEDFMGEKTTVFFAFFSFIVSAKWTFGTQTSVISFFSILIWARFNDTTCHFPPLIKLLGWKQIKIQF